jgi:hypothetical protein
MSLLSHYLYLFISRQYPNVKKSQEWIVKSIKKKNYIISIFL